MSFRWRSVIMGCVGAASAGYGITAHANSEYAFSEMRGSMKNKFMQSSGGSDTLTVDGFARSALQLQPGAHIKETNIELLKQILGSNTITLEAYKCYMLLLGASFREIKTAFSMFDISNDGLLRPSEYELFFKSFNGGVGIGQIPPLPDKLEELITVVRSLTGVLAQIEFNQFGTKDVTSEQAAQHLGSEHSERVASLPPFESRDWADLMKTARREVDICFALRVFDSANKLTKASFKRVIQMNCPRITNTLSSDFLWALFFNPATQRFDVAAFQNCLRDRKHFGIARPDYQQLISKRNMIQSFAHCMQGK